MLEKTSEELSALLADADIDTAIDKINAALEKASQPFRVDSISLTDDEELRPCKCVRKGIIGYDETCRLINGKWVCTRKPIYGCQEWDCT